MGWLIPAAVVLLIAVGRVILGREFRRLEEDREFAQAYLGAFRRYLAGDGADAETYSWLVHRSQKLQRKMGSHGIASTFVAPFNQHTVTNYRIILNALPEVRRGLSDSILRSLASEYAQMIQEAIIRYDGDLDDALDQAQGSKRNPFTALRQGTQALIQAPAYLMHWLGLARGPSMSSTGIVLRVSSGLLALFGLASSVISIVVGWSDFLAILARVFG